MNQIMSGRIIEAEISFPCNMTENQKKTLIEAIRLLEGALKKLKQIIS